MFRRIDPRLVIGVLLVAVAAIGVFTIVNMAARTQTVYAAAQPIAAGQAIPAESLVEVQIADDSRADLYLAPDRVPGGALISTRPIGEGELVPLSGIGDADDSRTTVVIALSSPLPQDIGVGTNIAVWAAAPGERSGTFNAPTIVTSDAQVIRVIDQERLVGTSAQEVEISVDVKVLPEVLAHMANGSQLLVVATNPNQRP